MFKLNMNSFILATAVIFTLNAKVMAATADITKTANTATASSEQKIEQDFDGLGGNGVLLEKAQALNPEVRTSVVQNRMVDRSYRFELAGGYENTFGGDTYVRTGTFTVNGQFHFSNYFSLGAKYGSSFNKLTNEGNNIVDKAAADHAANPATSTSPVPDIDYPKDFAMGYVNIYPLYGKISWLGKGISHFDVYGQLGYGNINLKSGGTSAMSGGMGVGIWGTQHLTTRLELIYTSYKAKYLTEGDIQMGITSASVQVGWLF